MTRITDVLVVPAAGADYFEDLSALQAESTPLPEKQAADATMPTGGIVRGVSEAISVGLVLDHKQVAWGDCVAGVAGGKVRSADAFRTADGLATVRRVIVPFLKGRELTSFRNLVTMLDGLTEVVELTRPLPSEPAEDRAETKKDDDVQNESRRALFRSAARLLSPLPELQQAFKAGADQAAVPTERVRVERPLHTAVRYGVSQALLQAVALTRAVTMAEVIAQEWDLPLPASLVPVHAQSGSDRYASADRMIVRRVGSLPHAPVDNVADQVGLDGAKLTRYVRWLKERIQELGGDDYHPAIHIDACGALGQIFENDLGKVFGQLFAIESAATPYVLRVESPVIADSRDAQIDTLKTLRGYVQIRRMKLQLVTGEWASSLDDIRAFVDAGAADMIHVNMPALGSVHNSVEAVLACQAGGVGVLLGGTCAETDLAARAAVHVALATRPDSVMARPGAGVDEGVALVQNEMARALSWIRARNQRMEL